MMNEPTDRPPPRHIVLTSHPRAGRAKPPKIIWGAASAAARGPVIGTLVGCQPAQRDRRPCRRLCALSRARDRRRQPERAASARSHQHGAGRADRAASAVGRPDQDRLARSLRPHGRRGVRRAARRRLGHPPDDRGDQGAPHRARAQARGPPRQASSRTAGSSPRPARSTAPRSRSSRSGTCRASPRAAASSESEPAPPSVRADRRHVPRAGDAARPQGVPAADRRPHRLYLRRPRQRSPIRPRKVACRVHDECNGSDVFGSDICTCRPYLVHGIEVCIATAQAGGVGADRLQPQGGQGARRGDQVPGLQRAQAAGGRRQRRGLFRAHRVRRRRAGRALPGADAGRAALARHQRASTAWSR